MLKWFEQKKPLVILAPMADYTDSPFTQLCRKISGKDFIVFKEMVSSEAVVRGNEKTLKMCKFEKIERPLIIQIFGDNPETMAKAAKIIESKFKPDGIDINMGCPVPKIAQKSGAGAALMRNPTIASDIVKSVKKAVKLPVSVKTRLGWNNKEEILKFVLILERAGADLITIHGRTKSQGYSGIADWDTIAEVKKIVKIPVITNGDIVDFASAKKCLEITKADGIMIGRGALGKPWIFQEIKKSVIARPKGSWQSHCLQKSVGLLLRRLADRNDNNNIIEAVLKHAKLHEKYYRQGSLITFRKHLGFYFKGIPNTKELKMQLMQVKEYKELEKILKNIK
ncbi:MAG: tRNA dihydrouridine synthase DusB [Candidatus Magasanikbacteria bacterium]|nr:tRNA dihydrouridine synthase DusB [Candidatus Magasanikbacteria bacterium]